MALPSDAVPTIHIQTGPEVYIFETDEIIPNDENLLEKIWKMDLKEVQGTAQGQGIETIWWDGTNESIEYSNDARALKKRADFIRGLLATDDGAKEKKIILVQVKRERGNANRKTGK